MNSGPLSVKAVRKSRIAPRAAVLSVGQVIDFVHAVAANCLGLAGGAVALWALRGRRFGLAPSVAWGALFVTFVAFAALA